ncbi:putative olfactory receptor 10D3 [Esox lucius]|uniref:putative olfactory receptor 10D3 n=1 Tax=Esox lucius TaxID=8010 RepID=UPI00147738F9|nr:putative olfactory receptor 10D3 [Esox lucius]
MRGLQRWFTRLRLDPVSHRRRLVEVPSSLELDLAFWRDPRTLLCGIPMGRAGVTCQSRSVRGVRPPSERHINWLELDTIRRMLLHFAPTLRDRDVLVPRMTSGVFIRHCGGGLETLREGTGGSVRIPGGRALPPVTLPQWDLALVLEALCDAPFEQIAHNKPLHTPMYFFICLLAMVDIVYTSGISVTMLNVLLGEERRVPYGPCMLQCFLFHLGSSMEPFTIALMAYDRLIAIVHPLRYLTILTNTNVFLLIIATWGVGCLFSGFYTGFLNSLPYCTSNKLPYSFCEYAALVRAACVDPAYYFTIASTLVTSILCVNFGLIFFSYMKIVYEVLKMSSEDRRKVYSTCVSHIIVVVCFFIPKVLLVFVTRFGLVLTLTQRNGLIIGSTLGPSLVNPFVYCLKTKEIRGRLKNIFSRCKITPNINL